MRAKCYLFGNETDEFTIFSINPDIAICFDCEEVRKQVKNQSNPSKFMTKAIMEEQQYWLKQILKGGETHGNQR